MNKHVLVDILKTKGLARQLSSLLPGEDRPWLMRDSKGKIIAIVDIVQIGESEPYGTGIVAEMHWNHTYDDELVIAFLEDLKHRVGGTIEVDPFWKTQKEDLERFSKS